MTFKNVLIVKGNGGAKESGLNALTFHSRFRHDFIFTESTYGQKSSRQKTGVFRPTAVLAKKWKLHRDDFHVATRQRYRRAGRVDKNVSVADIEESETARSPVVLLASI